MIVFQSARIVEEKFAASLGLAYPNLAQWERPSQFCMENCPIRPEPGFYLALPRHGECCWKKA
jgi:hypothetical protein